MVAYLCGEKVHTLGGRIKVRVAVRGMVCLFFGACVGASSVVLQPVHQAIHFWTRILYKRREGRRQVGGMHGV